MTNSRRIIVRLFVETKDHLKPEEVYQLVREHNVSLPTVYRTLEILKKIGVIKELTLRNERIYELNIYSQKILHIHFQCSNCGEIKEYKDLPLVKSMIEQRDYIEEKYEDDIDDITIVMKGVCRLCRKNS